MQDTLKQKIIVREDTLKHLSDTARSQKKIHSDTVIVHRVIPKIIRAEIAEPDTAFTCSRNSIADVNYYDSANFIYLVDSSLSDRFPFLFTTMNRQRSLAEKESILVHLKEGTNVPKNPYQVDWIVSIIIVSAFLYAVLRTTSAKIFRGLLRFISFSSINESASREMPEIFQWQSTLFNLTSFLNISLFGFLLAIRYGITLPSVGGFVLWAAFLGIVIAAITLRHIVCRLTGNLSGQDEIFSEYLAGIYHSYRIAGFLLLITNVLILYTTIVPVNFYFNIGFIVISVLYLIRILRLFLIFLNRHVSILYLILYLCALEILPVVILVKYVTGLVV
jgi:hypothetical protein